MQWVTDLKGKGEGKQCLLIGAGMSVEDFDFMSLPDDFIRICINDALPKDVRIDYLIYNDPKMIPVIKKLVKKNELPQSVKVISFGNSQCDRTDYCYRNSHFGCVDSDNTGLKALLLAKEVMNFDKIFLIGYDFHTNLINGIEVSHFQGDPIGHDTKFPVRSLLDQHFKRLKDMVFQFEIIKNIAGIYNCYKNSKLRKFEYALPY